MLARRTAIAAVILVALTALTSCATISGWFGDDDEITSEDISVFDAEVGDCFLAPAEVKAELPTLSRIDCDVPHQQELYASVEFDTDADEYPGNSALDTYALGQCAQEFETYIGIAYPDSGLWITHLLPSARSWQQGDDRSILCFITTTTGGELVGSTKGSRS